MFSQRPFSVTLLLWMVLSLSAWGAIRSFAALRWWDVLYEFNASLGPLYLLITGVLWGVVGVFLLWSIWSGKAWSRIEIIISMLLWLAEYWVERLFFQSPRVNLPFALILSALLLAVTFASALNRSAKNFLTKSEEHEQSNEHSAPA
jgi:glucose dehydrogenase